MLKSENDKRTKSTGERDATIEHQLDVLQHYGMTLLCLFTPITKHFKLKNSNYFYKLFMLISHQKQRWHSMLLLGTVSHSSRLWYSKTLQRSSDQNETTENQSNQPKKSTLNFSKFWNLALLSGNDQDSDITTLDPKLSHRVPVRVQTPSLSRIRYTMRQLWSRNSNNGSPLSSSLLTKRCRLCGSWWPQTKQRIRDHYDKLETLTNPLFN